MTDATASAQREAAVLVPLGGVLRESRLRLRLSIEGAASRIGISRSSLGQYERGERVLSVVTLLAVCRVYGLDAGALLDLFDSRKEDEVCAAR